MTELAKLAIMIAVAVAVIHLIGPAALCQTMKAAVEWLLVILVVICAV